MGKFLKEFGVIFLWFISFILAYGYFCDFFFTQEKFFDKKYKPAWILSQKDRDVDFAILGSSRAYSAFDMNLLDSITDKKWINLGSNGSGMAENYMAFNHFLKRNIVNTILIQVDVDVLVGNTNEQNRIHPYSFLPYWHDSVVNAVLKKEIKSLDNFLIGAVPQFRYFYFNKYFSPKEIVRRLMINKEPDQTLDRLFGGEPIDERSKKVGVKIKKEKRNHFENFDLNPYLLKIIDLAESRKINILFFTAPIYYGEFDAVISYMEQSDYPTYLPEERLQKDESLYLDTWHLNEKGRRQFTLSFISGIASNYLFSLSSEP